MKGKKTVTAKSKRTRIIKYSAFTALLTCVIVAGYYLASNGVIFGKYFSKAPYIDQKYIDNPNLVQTEAEANPDLTVTAKNSFGSYKTPSLNEQGELVERLGFREKESYTGATQFSGKREIYFNLGNQLKLGDPYTTLGVAAVDKDAKLTLYSAEFVKGIGDDSGKRPVSIFSVNETTATKDKDSSRTDVSWNPDGSVTFVTKDGGMRFYIDGSQKQPIDLKEYGYLKLVVDSESEAMVSGYKSLPAVPKTDGTVQKGTKGNPLVILEIVPDMAQQSLSLLVSSQEEGLPVDPIEFGMEVTRKKNVNFIQQHHTDNLGDNVTGFRDVWAGEGTSAVTNTGLDNQLGGWFNNNNGGTMYEIYNPSGTVPGADHKTQNENDRTKAPFVYLTAHYTVNVKCDRKFGANFKQNGGKKPIADIQKEYPDLFVDKDGKTIDERVLRDDKNWAWSYSKDDAENKEYRVSVIGNESFAADLQKYKNKELTFTQLAAAHPDIFNNTLDGRKILEQEIQRADSWSLEKEENQVEGFYVFVGGGNGDFNLDPYNIWVEGDHSKNKWKYFESKEEIPQEYTYNDIWQEGTANWQMGGALNSAAPGDGFPASRMSRTNHPVTNQPLKTKSVVTFRYRYDGYIFKFEYVGIRFNDILKRMFFYYEDEKDSDGKVVRTADEQYDDTYIKIITLTPSMINQMDADDTPDTLDYIERADMFYVSSYNAGTDGINNLLALYKNFVAPERDKNTFQSVSGELASFHENDLEWVDCMKIIKRLSGDSSLPMMFSSQVGSILDEGVTRDGALDMHMYIDDKVKCGKKPGSLNNLSKLYLITTQFDLSASKDKPNNKIEYVTTFMDDIYDNIKQVPLGADDERDPDSAKYTGFYQRPNLCGESGVSDIEKQKVYYLWNILTFLPDVPTTPEDKALYDTNHTELKWENLLPYGFLKSSFVGSSNYRHSYLPNRGTEMGRVTGTVDPEADYQNVVVVHRKDQVDNGNFSIFEGGVFNFQGMLIYKILNNGTPLTPKMTFGVLNTKESRKYYQKISNDSVLMNYDKEASYKDSVNKNKDMLLYIHCNLNNADNEETSIITSISLVNPDTGEKEEIVPQKLDGTELHKKAVDFSESQNVYAKITGYEVSKNDSLKFMTPFSLKKWQLGYTMLRVDWVARTSKLKGTNFTPYQNPHDPTNQEQVETAKQYAEVNIGERGLFALQ